jgi:hypothetical protein
VRFRVIAATIIAAALSLGIAGSARASLPTKTRPAPQVSGVRLASALLPASAWGDGFTAFNSHNSGSTLHSTHAVIRPSGLSCVNFETYTYIAGFGNTAGAVDSILNPNPALGYPNVILGGDQAVLQFNSVRAAASFYNRADTRYGQCSAFTEPYAAEQTTLEVTTQSLSSTTIGTNQAFQLIQHADVSSMSAQQFYEVTAVVLAGTNVYMIHDVNGTNDPVSALLLSNFISLVQALYKHR